MTTPVRSDRSALAEWRRSVDWSIIAACFGLIGAGLLLALAAGPPAAERIGKPDSFFFVHRQVVFAAAAIVLLLTASLLNARWVRRLSGAVFLSGFVLMAIILFAGHEANGAQRWIRVAGLSLQPSELVKPSLIVMVAWLLAQRQIFRDGPWTLVAFAFFASTLGLLILQPDIGQSALLTAAFVITFFVSGLPWRLAAAFAAGGAMLSGALYAALPHVRRRVDSFLDPSSYETYQIDKAQEAIARGGWLGAGPGEGEVKRALPEAHTDFVYAVAGEEFGLMATIGLTAVYAFIALRGTFLAARLDDPYPRAAATGLFALFGLQAAINLGVNLSLVPPKGMTLPFVSYGGSSMLGVALTLGFALALIRPARMRGPLRSAYV